MEGLGEVFLDNPPFIKGGSERLLCEELPDYMPGLVIMKEIFNINVL